MTGCLEKLRFLAEFDSVCALSMCCLFSRAKPINAL
jgi:hypothetical protein